MAKSRYTDVPIIDKHHYGTFSVPTNPNGNVVDLLEGIPTFDYVFQRGDRLDHLAAKFLGQDSYWWVIALVNNYGYSFSIPLGTMLKIPNSVNDVFAKLFR